jgi:hypothetical protein
MSAVKWVGYILAAILVLSILIAGGAILSVIGALIAIGLCATAVIGLTAVLIREYVESKKDHSPTGDPERDQQGHP